MPTEPLPVVDDAGLDTNALDADSAFASPETTEPSTPEERIAWLELALAQTRDQHLRLLAEFDNFRRRTQRERAESRELFTADVWRRIVGVLDDMQRGLESNSSGEDFRRGVEIAMSRLLVQMAADHIERISTVGDPFDPRRHIAIVEQPTSDAAQDGIVLNESGPAYVMGDRVLKPAEVVVGRLTTN